MGRDIGVFYVEGGGMFVHPLIKFDDKHKENRK